MFDLTEEKFDRNFSRELKNFDLREKLFEIDLTIDRGARRGLLAGRKSGTELYFWDFDQIRSGWQYLTKDGLPGMLSL